MKTTKVVTVKDLLNFLEKFKEEYTSDPVYTEHCGDILDQTIHVPVFVGDTCFEYKGISEGVYIWYDAQFGLMIDFEAGNIKV